MIKNARELRWEARQALRGKWLIAIVAFIIAALLGAFTTSASFNTGNSTQDIFSKESVTVYNEQGEPATIENPYASLEDVYGEEFLETYEAATTAVMFTAGIVALVLFLIGGAIELGYYKLNIDFIEGNEARLSTLFSRFGIFFKALWLRFLTFAKIFLWMLLFIIPGIIASYRYAMAPYIMAENPKIKAGEAIKISSKMMKGYKWRLFCLQLSFIGWELLTLITCGIAGIWVNPYQQASFASFYKMVSANYVQAAQLEA